MVPEFQNNLNISGAISAVSRRLPALLVVLDFRRERLLPLHLTRKW